ncbi:MAG: PAS domain S-box protein [Theionarchaea archaeon]|nr:PAS domain S-box protein [Theionarchaea archaeon]
MVGLDSNSSDELRKEKKIPDIQVIQWKTIFDAISDAILLLDPENKITGCNQAMANLVKKSTSEIIGRTCWEIIHGTSEPIEGCPIILSRKTHSRETQDLEINNRWFRGSADPIFDNEGNFIGAVHILSDISERKRAERDLLVTYSAIESSINAIAITDVEGKLTYANPSFLRMWGYEVESEVLGKCAAEFWQDENQAWQMLKALVNTGGWIGELVAKRKDGSLLNIQLSASLILDESGKPLYMMGSLVDITQRKSAEIALQKSEEKYRTLTENINVGVYRYALEPERRFVEINSAIVEMFGYASKEEFLAANSTDMFLNLEEGMKFVERALEEGFVTNEEILLKRKDGSSFNGLVSALAMISEKGRSIFFDGIVEDITDRKQMEETLRENEARYRELADRITDVFFAMNTDLRCTYWNKACEELTGILEKDAIGKSLQDNFSDTPQTRRAEKVYRDVLRTQRSKTFVIEYQSTGRHSYFEISVYPSRDGISVFIRDITEREEAERKLREYSENLEKMVEERTQELRDAQEELIGKEKLATLGQFAASVGHELRNPLGAIRNSVYFLNMRLKDPDEKVTKHLTMIDKSIQQADKIITDLLDLSWKRPPSPIQSSINDVVRGALEMSAIPEFISVETYLDESIPIFSFDPHQIQVVFLNIIANAVQAMPREGILQIETELKDDFVLIRFKDTGEGIPKDDIDRIFDPFFTTKARGIGLGLPMVKSIVKGHDGTIEVKSEIGKGTIVTVKIPVD